MNINKRICLKIAEAIKEHGEQINHDDIVGCLLSTATAFSNVYLGKQRTLIQLASQMSVVAGNDLNAMEKVIAQTYAANEKLKNNPEFKDAIRKINGSVKKVNDASN